MIQLTWDLPMKSFHADHCCKLCVLSSELVYYPGMKANIHPAWYDNTQVTCACGATFTTGSTLPKIRVEICSQCHPLFTGQQKFVDTLGQVERFQKKAEVSKVKQAERAKIAEARKAKVEEIKKEKPSLKDLLLQARKQAAS